MGLTLGNCRRLVGWAGQLFVLFLYHIFVYMSVCKAMVLVLGIWLLSGYSCSAFDAPQFC